MSIIGTMPVSPTGGSIFGPSLPPRMLDDHRGLDFDDQERALRRGQTGTSTLVNRRFGRAEVPDPGEVVMLPPLEVPVTT